MSTAIIIPAAGRGERFGNDKLFVDLDGTPLLGITLRHVAAAAIFGKVVVVAPAARWDLVRDLAQAAGIEQPILAEGGETRQRSVLHGLRECLDAEVVCVHDAARPLCPPRVFAAVVAAAAAVGAATAALPCVDTIKRVHSHGQKRSVRETLDRSELVAVQTPQAFLTDILRQAHDRAEKDGILADDDCALVERGGGRVSIVDGDPRAFKVTRPEDLVLLRACLAEDAAGTPI